MPHLRTFLYALAALVVLAALSPMVVAGAGDNPANDKQKPGDARQISTQELLAAVATLDSEQAAWSVVESGAEQLLLADRFERRGEQLILFSDVLVRDGWVLLSSREIHMGLDGRFRFLVERDADWENGVELISTGKTVTWVRSTDTGNTDVPRPEGYRWNKHRARFEHSLGAPGEQILSIDTLAYLAARVDAPEGSSWSGKVIHSEGIDEASLEWGGVGDLIVDGETWDTHLITLSRKGAGAPLELHAQDNSLRMMTSSGGGMLIHRLDYDELLEEQKRGLALIAELSESTLDFLRALHAADKDTAEQYLWFPEVQRTMAIAREARKRMDAGELSIGLNQSVWEAMAGEDIQPETPADEFRAALLARLAEPATATMWVEDFIELPTDPKDVDLQLNGNRARALILGDRRGYSLHWENIEGSWKMVWWAGFLEIEGLIP